MVKPKKNNKTAPKLHIANGGQSELLFYVFQRHLSVSGQVSAPIPIAIGAATGRMRNVGRHAKNDHGNLNQQIA